MKKSVLALITAGAVAGLLSASLAFSASPLSITFNGEGTAAAGAYQTFEVKCSDGQLKTITLWETDNKWCVGDQGTENCTTKKIKAAKAACK
jgi:hypothetical protein